MEVEPDLVHEAATAKLAIYKLTAEEVAFKPVPLMPGLAELSHADLAAVPAMRQSGPFNAFTTPEDGRPGQQWVVSSEFVCDKSHFLLLADLPCLVSILPAASRISLFRTVSQHMLCAAKAHSCKPIGQQAAVCMHGCMQACLTGSPDRINRACPPGTCCS